MRIQINGFLLPPRFFVIVGNGLENRGSQLKNRLDVIVLDARNFTFIIRKP